MSDETILERIHAFPWKPDARVVVRKVARGYSLFSARTGAPVPCPIP